MPNDVQEKPLTKVESGRYNFNDGDQKLETPREYQMRPAGCLR